MEKYDIALSPNPFGLINNGAICYFNSFLQTLSGCTAFTSMILKNQEYMSRTGTGLAMYNFVKLYIENVAPISSGLASQTQIILNALITALNERRPGHNTFGRGQESAHEVFILLLDMMEPIDHEDEAESTEFSSIISSIKSPITKLFLHKCEWNTCCLQCHKNLSKKIDYGVIFDMHHMESQDTINYIMTSLNIKRNELNSPSAFSKFIKTHISPVEGFICPDCNSDANIYRIYNLRRIPEIVFCSFNIYYQQNRRVRYIPPYIEFDSSTDDKMRFNIIGQIEHSGSLGGGHYWARGLRKDKVYELNDLNVAPSSFQSTPYTYMVIYHIT